MRQQDLVEALDHVIARSTLANVEVGRENPSARLWQAINLHLPDWVESLESWYLPARSARQQTPFELAGPYDILQANYVYTFRDHRAPEEIIQVRRVRAMQDGADGYGLKLSNNSGHFDLDTEALWGGWIERHDRKMTDSSSLHLTRFHFERALRRGQVHEFATRSWVSHDEPGDEVSLMFTRPVNEAMVALNFTRQAPRQVWTFGPVADLELAPDAPASPKDLVRPLPNGMHVMHVRKPLTGHQYGIAWTW